MLKKQVLYIVSRLVYRYINMKGWCILELLFNSSVNDNSTIDNKIIVSNKTRQHMVVHQNDFQIPYHNIIKYMESKGYFNDLKDGFVEMIVEFPFNIGYTSLVETDSTHNVLYAKRKNRDIYSRFTKNVKKRLTNKCVVILNQSYTNSNESIHELLKCADQMMYEHKQSRKSKS